VYSQSSRRAWIRRYLGILRITQSYREGLPCWRAWVKSSNIKSCDPNTRRGGLFAEYIFIIKIGSGWRANARTTMSKLRNGVWRNTKKTERNPNLCSVAKLRLNLFWGKFGQRTNLLNIEIGKILPASDDFTYESGAWDNWYVTRQRRDRFYRYTDISYLFRSGYGGFLNNERHNRGKYDNVSATKIINI